MRIGLDGIFIHDGKTWAPSYARLYRLLALARPEWRWDVVLQSIRNRPNPLGPMGDGSNLSTRTYRLPRGLLASAWRRGLFSPDEDWNEYISVTWMLPPLRRARLILVVHDIAFRILPDIMPRERRRALILSLREALARTERIITISEASASDLFLIYGVPREKMHVVHLGVDNERFSPGAPDPEVLARYDLEPGYLLFVGTLEPRKNIVRMIEAHGRLEKAPPLVLAGMRGWSVERIEEAMDSAAPGRIRRLGAVPHGDLPALYRGASAVLLPSLHEGFGLPVLEAQASGIPVLASTGGALGEVSGGAALLVEAEDTDAISEGMKRIISDQDLRADLSVRGRENAARFGWDRVAAGWIAAIESLHT